MCLDMTLVWFQQSSELLFCFVFFNFTKNVVVILRMYLCHLGSGDGPVHCCHTVYNVLAVPEISMCHVIVDSVVNQ